jgi:SAM-dependent methyltransferase
MNKTMVEIYSCKVCSSKHIRKNGVRNADYITGEKFELVSCDVCGTVFTSPEPINLEPYYPDKYRKYGPIVMMGLSMVFWLSAFSITRYFRQVKNRSLLEVGCGPGLLMTFFKKQGWNATGIERNEKMASVAREDYCLDVRACAVEDLPIDEKFDLILMFNVLEHLSDPNEIIRHCRDRLNENGRIIITVPDYNCWQRRVFNQYWLHLDVPRHLNHFHVASMDFLADSMDLKILSYNAGSVGHDLFGWIDSSCSKLFKKQNIITSWLMGLDGLSTKLILSIFLSPIIFFFCLPITAVSLFFGKSALKEFHLSKKLSISEEFSKTDR